MSSLTTRISDLATRVGTEFKTVKTHYSGNNQGSLTSLQTDVKTSLLAAINELHTELGTKEDALGFTPEDSANKGVANGYAELDASGKVPSAQLPSFVDDVQEYADYASLPGTGEAGIIYVTLDDNKTYRWGGTAYVNIGSSLALGETSDTAYRGDRGKTAYDHSQATGNQHSMTFAQLNSKPTTIAGYGITDAYTESEVNTLLDGYSLTTHNHDGDYEALISKSAGYAKWTGSAWSFVNETYSLSSHNHSGVYEPANSNIQSHISATNIHIDWTNAPESLKTSGSINIETSGNAAFNIEGGVSSTQSVNFTNGSAIGSLEFFQGKFTFMNMPTTQLVLNADGTIRMPEYGVGTITGTKAYYSAWDADGDLIELSSIPWSDISSTPTTLAGYGITDAASSSHNHNGVYEPANSNIQTHISTSNIHINWTNTNQNLKTSGTLTVENAGSAYLYLTGNSTSTKAISFGDAGPGTCGEIGFGNTSSVNDFFITAGAGGTFLFKDTGAVAFQQYGDGSLTGSPTYFAGWDANGVFVEFNTISWSVIASKPTTLAGYGITDAYTKTEIGTPDTNFVAIFEAALT